MADPQMGIMPDDFPKTLNLGNAQTVASLNERLKKQYNDLCDGLEYSIRIGRGASVMAQWPSKPPTGYTLAPPDEAGVTWPVPSGQPVCAARVPPQGPGEIATRKPNHIHIGHQLPSMPGWWSVGDDDGVNSGDTVPGTSDDGVTGMWLKFGAAVGPGWYRRTS